MMSERTAVRVTWFDRMLIAIAPTWGVRRVRARAVARMLSRHEAQSARGARHYEAAQGGRRTSGWQRFSGDANAAVRSAHVQLRELSRDLVRNNGWAENGMRVIATNVVGWGIVPRLAAGPVSERAAAVWKAWSESTACDYDGMLPFVGLENLAMRTIAESGEVLILKQPADGVDVAAGLPVPMRIQVLEPDYIDTLRSRPASSSEAEIVDGIEIDARGHRIAYWLHTSHPGAAYGAVRESVRIPADRVLHIYRVDRPGQRRGVPWLASAIAKCKDLDDFEDAEIIKQKVAACFSAFVHDANGADTTALGTPSLAAGETFEIDELQPGQIVNLPAGKQVTFGTPPATVEGEFSTRTLRRIASSIGVTYEDLTNDYSQVNFSSGRMARLAHWNFVHAWRWHMMVPRMCAPIWQWVIGMAAALEAWSVMPPAPEWAAPPMPILEPDREGLAYQRLVRNGFMTQQQVIRELGEDPSKILDEIQAWNRELDRREIILDSDPRRASAAGQLQSSGDQKTLPAGDAATEAPAGAAADPPSDAADTSDDPAA